MDVSISLDQVGMGCSARVHSVNGEEAMRRRLMELGFTPESPVIPIYRAAGGDPTAYWVRGTVIALRADDAARIAVVI